MTYAVYSPIRNRIYIRKYDHDECRRLYAQGASVSELAERYGVTTTAITICVDPEARARNYARASAFYKTSCEDCGNPCLIASAPMKRAKSGRSLCAICSAKERRENVQVDGDGTVIAVHCASCKEWKPAEAFGKGKRYPDLREGGFHNGCRACNVAMRRAYRNRHKVPCEGGCGRLVEGKGRVQTNTRPERPGGRGQLDPDRPHLCAECWHKSPAGQEAHAKAFTSSAAVRRSTL